jgi:UDP-N-acetylglucosamine 4,6-dehydratase (inverting)
MSNKKILITGGTGTFGKAFVKFSANRKDIKKIFVYSRDEMKQWNMSKELECNPEKVQFVIGDVRDLSRLNAIIRDNKIDYIIHAAATKIVLSAEYNPEECIKTNILGAMNIVEASKNNNVKKVIALSTDKASNPINLYGATKLASDKLFISANLNSNNKSTIFAVVRYGNVMGSRGSVIPFFLSLNKKEKFPITNPEMTRFMISVEESLKMVFVALEKSIGGEIFIKKSPSIKITDLAKYIHPHVKFRIIGERAGEKIHEQMIGFDESKFVYDFKDYFVIFPSIINLTKFSKIIKTGKRVKKGFVYSSDNNNLWLSPNEFRNWLSKFQYKS